MLTLTWPIAALATAGVILRPFGWPEFVWAVSGAVLLPLLGLLSPAEALDGVVAGGDVYMFLIGMMLLSELARQEGLFDWLAGHAAGLARGSAARLFALVFATGVLVTVFLSNDATAVVLTPAVAAVVKAARAEAPLPYLLICAFVANAASFVLPISNPANLVIFAGHMPPLAAWLRQYGLASLLAILASYAVLRWTQRGVLHGTVAGQVAVAPLSVAGRMAGFGLVATALVLLGASALGWQLGLPTLLAGVAAALLVLTRSACGPVALGRGISWGVLPLVAGLFVLVAGLEKTGVTRALADELQALAGESAGLAAWGAGVGLALGCNLVNNLPAGLVAGQVVAKAPEAVRRAVLIGVDLGPNLSVTGSLATILWLAALRREGLAVSTWQFLKLGVLVMPPALLLALAAVLFS